ncbi:MAG TPA: Panacea domain-containing protein [Pyrinomonadaceae bacterium]|jgi:hypothetical protein|nr:Panacea domain-containing protein [Pyrinomonadaceae bacterium]
MTKLFKLLYFLDFEHYKKTGRSVTGLKYFAWPMGPVPVSLKDEISHPEEYLKEKVFILEVPHTFRTAVAPDRSQGDLRPRALQ